MQNKQLDHRVHRPVPAKHALCLILGNESAGVCQPLLDASDATAHISKRGENSSMNVVNACAIAACVITGELA